MGLLAPAKTPDAIVQRLNAEVAKALAQPDLKARLKDLGLNAFGSAPAQFDSYLRSESSRWGKADPRSKDRGRIEARRKRREARAVPVCAK